MDIAQVRFLVVEDHGFQRWLAGNLLRELGAKAVFLADDGSAALELLGSVQPPIDIVVSDLDMPRMDGMALIRCMSEMRHPASLIVASAMDRQLVASVETMARTFGVTLLGAMPKPITARKLMELIARHRPEGASPAAVPGPVFDAGDLREALRAAQIEVFFQPKVHLFTGKVLGAEALARWRHPSRGIVHPQHFIGQIEAHGLVDELTAAVLREAAGHCARWRGAGIDMHVSVNISPSSLGDPEFAGRTIDAVRAQNLDPCHVTLEVTELAARELGTKLENLARLRMRGFGLSIDDFGTGYSTLERLARVPFTELKIDQQFVCGASARPSSRAVVESSLELAAKMGLAAVAEGVETQADWQLLLGLGCPSAQGYYISRPLDAAEFFDWLRMRNQVTA